MKAKPNFLPDEIIKSILLEQNIVTLPDIQDAEQLAITEERTLVSVLIQKNLIDQHKFGETVAKYYETSFIDFNKHPASADIIEHIPKYIAIDWRVVFVSEDDEGVVIATDQPNCEGLDKALEIVYKKKDIIIAYALPDAIDNILLFYRTPLQESVRYILEHNAEDIPGIIDAVFDEALTKNVSDIHFEPRRSRVVVRFRIDGLLEEVLSLRPSVYMNIVNRIKVESFLRIDDHFAAQDGAMRYDGQEHSADMRISIIPTMHGEKICIRVLSKYVRDLALLDLGMSSEHQLLLQRASQKPFGLILVVGPTGSGKSTTLYSLMSILNRPDVNITTIEDPVEYKINDINQIQVNLATGLTFARGLRSIVRQDPDVILIGEIRDQETAEIAVNAALTGHLVLSTVHANDAATAIPRLLDMGIEPFLLASTLELVVGQRLVRKLVADARKEITEPIADASKRAPYIDAYVKSKNIKYFEADEEANKNGRAYAGRTAVYEMIPITDAIEDLIIKRPSARDILKRAKIDGMISMFEDGLKKAQQGITSLSELLRVVQPVEPDSEK